MDRLSSVGILASRILLSGIFLFSATSKVFAFAKTQAYMAQHGMHMTGLFLVLAILFELCGGFSVLSGYYPRLGALALILFLAPTTLVFHRELGNPAQAVQFAKNLAIMGGLLAILSVGGGDFTIMDRKGGKG
ncbi:MAG: DoxX family protein [Deltaproteobacteria bacterium]|nr:DoxX family protein [Deltaproteobacteria bacterium]